MAKSVNDIFNILTTLHIKKHRSNRYGTTLGAAMKDERIPNPVLAYPCLRTGLKSQSISDYLESLGWILTRRCKVADIYHHHRYPGYQLEIETDRVCEFGFVLPVQIAHKGEELAALAHFWRNDRVDGINIQVEAIPDDWPDDFPRERSVLVRQSNGTISICHRQNLVEIQIMLSALEQGCDPVFLPDDQLRKWCQQINLPDWLSGIQTGTVGIDHLNPEDVHHHYFVDSKVWLSLPNEIVQKMEVADRAICETALGMKLEEYQRCFMGVRF
jgi:hypothetical protein